MPTVVMTHMTPAGFGGIVSIALLKSFTHKDKTTRLQMSQPKGGIPGSRVCVGSPKRLGKHFNFLSLQQTCVCTHKKPDVSPSGFCVTEKLRRKRKPAPPPVNLEEAGVLQPVK